MTNHSIAQLKLGAKPPVTVKGTKHGLLFILDEHVTFSELLDGLKGLLQGQKSGLFSGPNIGIYVDYGSRELSAQENRVLLDVFLEQPNFIIREWSAKTTERQLLFSNASRHALNYTVYRGTVRSGQELQFDGDVILIGDVNPGGQISATGDVYIFGRLNGIAHAGISGNAAAIIAAVDFAPVQLRIADYVGYAPEENGKPLRSHFEFAYVKEEVMAVDKMQYLTPFLEYRAQSDNDR